MELLEFIKENRWDYKNDKKIETFFDFEKEYIEHIHNNKFSLTVKARQMYISTLTVLYCAWLMINKKDIQIYFLSPGNNLSKNKLLKLHDILVKYGLEMYKNNLNVIELENGNSFSIKTSVDSLRGINLANSIIIFDEAAYKRDLKEIFSATLTNLGNGKIIMYSTPSGDDNYFNELTTSDNAFSKLTLPYYLNPNYNIKWVENICNIIGVEKFKTEYECSLEQIKKSNPKSNLIQFRVDDDLYNKIALKLIKNDQSTSEYLRNLVLKDV